MGYIRLRRWPLWLARRRVPAPPKRRRRCALPAHSKRPPC